MPSFSDFRSDSPVILMCGLGLSSSCSACGLFCAPDSRATSLAVHCSNFFGLRGLTGIRTCIRRRLRRCPASLCRPLYLIKRCRDRIEFVDPLVGITCGLRSITSGTRLTGEGTRLPRKCRSVEPRVGTSGAVRLDPAWNVLVPVLTSNQQSTGRGPRQQTTSYRSTVASRLRHPRAWSWHIDRQLAHQLSRERK